MVRVGHIADAERRDEHRDHDQFLYHFGVLLQRLVRSGDSAYIADPNVKTIAARTNSCYDTTDRIISTNPDCGSSKDD